MDEPRDQPPQPPGHLRCESCGYDLHGNDTDRCPECGAEGPGVPRMPPEWRILVVALSIPAGIVVLWILWSMVAAVLR